MKDQIDKLVSSGNSSMSKKPVEQKKGGFFPSFFGQK